MTAQFLSLLKRLEEWQLLSDDRYTRDINIYLWKFIERIAINSYSALFSLQLCYFYPNWTCARTHATHKMPKKARALQTDTWPFSRSFVCCFCCCKRDRDHLFQLEIDRLCYSAKCRICVRSSAVWLCNSFKLFTWTEREQVCSDIVCMNWSKCSSAKHIHGSLIKI